MFEPEEQVADLDEAACRRLLASTRFGRVAVVLEDGRPHIVVLNHAVIGHDVFFRTTADATLVDLVSGGDGVPAEYEVDSAFPVGKQGWTVIASGELSLESDAKRIAAALERVEPWAHGDRDVVLHLRVTALRGRQVGPH